MLSEQQDRWCKDVRKSLIDREMSVPDLAREIGMSREHVASVVHGRILSAPTKARISEYLGIDCQIA